LQRLQDVLSDSADGGQGTEDIARLASRIKGEKEALKRKVDEFTDWARGTDTLLDWRLNLPQEEELDAHADELGPLTARIERLATKAQEVLLNERIQTVAQTQLEQENAVLVQFKDAYIQLGSIIAPGVLHTNIIEDKARELVNLKETMGRIADNLGVGESEVQETVGRLHSEMQELQSMMTSKSEGFANLPAFVARLITTAKTTVHHMTHPRLDLGLPSGRRSRAEAVAPTGTLDSIKITDHKLGEAEGEVKETEQFYIRLAHDVEAILRGDEDVDVGTELAVAGDVRAAIHDAFKKMNELGKKIYRGAPSPLAQPLPRIGFLQNAEKLRAENENRREQILYMDHTVKHAVDSIRRKLADFSDSADSVSPIKRSVQEEIAKLTDSVKEIAERRPEDFQKFVSRAISRGGRSRREFSSKWSR
jgi:hypothetical protein